MSIELDNKQGLIAGNGQLPVQLAKNAKENGFEVIAISLSSDNRKELKKYCSKVFDYAPGQVLKIKNTLLAENIKQLTFIGKVSKGLVVKRPKFDSLAVEFLKQAVRLNDDAIMLFLVEELNKIGITVLDQTIFIKNLMVPRGILGKIKPTESQLSDVEYGYKIAKEMGELDIGQSVVIKDRMIMAIEAIEGTDNCIKRGCKLGKKDSIIVKVAKPKQDKRFDIPAFGLNTIKTMKKYKAKLIAVEANETILVDLRKTIDYADKNNIVVMAV
ncbi:MAG: UDP-2,3-diacylglucosamine diphosphatase LpxI [Candidatus Gastranaerophilales bacterium]|nr:UDP-2,3-diacylglucosamine diphosphatase LpxI [Candidatus Gastranaerophilales bacterium]